MFGFLSIDGEADQIAMFESEDVRLSLREHFLQVAKSPASTSAKTQPMDITKLIQAEKKVMKHASTSDWTNSSLLKSLNEVNTLFYYITSPMT
jgi:hypothetical protein